VKPLKNTVIGHDEKIAQVEQLIAEIDLLLQQSQEFLDNMKRQSAELRKQLKQGKP
jgi:F0F1-type ATP synthase membrane subunit b/b'